MSYQVIARKWRPQTFEEVTGQEVITQTLRNALEHDRLHHAYLFSGARGVGKTTTARILAKALNCHKTDKINLTPCGITDPTACPSCIEISESRSMDVLEIDAASNTGIDDVRGTIIDNISFNPARDRFKVFIIDEVHQLSKPAFNALLKTLEEPPDNVIFVMATTELHKVPDTILSRCQEFEFRTIPLQKIFDRLKLIADAEKIDIDEDALRELARSGEGSMRDAQSNFDQVISFSGEKIAAQDVTNALGFAGVEILAKTIGALIDKEPRSILTIVDDIIARGHDLRNFCRDVLGLFRDLLIFKLAGSEKHLFEGAVFSEDELRSMSKPLSEADLLRFFNSLSETEASLKEAVHPRYVLEIGLIKLIEMRKLVDVETILERLQALSNGSPQIVVPVTAAASAASSDIPQEKKTLKSDLGDIETHLEEPPDEFIGNFEPIEPVPVREPRPQPKYEYAELQVVRLPPLTADDLEHIDDKRLDESYEEKLTFNGDDLSPLRDVSELVTLLLGSTSTVPAAAAYTWPANGSSGTAVKSVMDLYPAIPLPDESEIINLPQLGPDPTEDELNEHARAHPGVRSAIKVFRAKIVEVKRH